MSKCRDLEPLLASYVDGEAPDDQRASVETHIERCPPCRARVDHERAAHDVLQARRDGLRTCAPQALRARCAAHSPAAPAASLMARRPWLPLSLAATLLLAVAGVFAYGLTDTVQALATQLTVDHVTCFRIGKQTPTDPAVASQRWGASQGWDVTVPASSDSHHLQFVCLRRCLVTEGRVAHLMYKWRGEPLSVYVVPNAVDEGAAQQIVERFGHEAVVWNSRGRTYVVLSRGRPDELETVVQYVKASVQ